MTTQPLRAVEVRYKGRVYPGLARGAEFLGFVGPRMPRGLVTPEMREAVALACATPA